MYNNKNYYKQLINYCKAVVPNPECLKVGFNQGAFANYGYEDCKVIYKIIRMYALGLIDEEEYYNLIDLYDHYLVLYAKSNTYNYLRVTGNEYDVEDGEKVLEEYQEVEEELRSLHLLREYLDTQTVIDSAIKYEHSHGLKLKK